MKILFDHQIYNQQQYGGISRYFYELSKGLRNTETEVKNSVVCSDNVYTSDPLYTSIKFHLKKNFKGKTRLYKFINTLNSIKCLNGELDVFHPTNYETYFLRNIKKPFVITFYDLIHENFKDRYGEFQQHDILFDNRKLLLDKCTKVIAISQSTKNDIIKIYGTNPEKISVIYLSSSLGKVENIESNNPFGNYILYVGNRNSYKNFLGFIKAISSLLLKEKDLKILCAGGGEFDINEMKILSDLKIISQVRQLAINDTILTHLYKNALFFVFPSLYEGFGIPILEAFSCGCPALISNTSSLPEVGGEAAFYLDPESEEDILNKVTELLYSDSLRTSFKARGLVENERFSWKNTVNQHKLLYDTLS